MPLSRFDRNYRLTVQVGDGRSVIVRPPIRVSFSADKSVSGGLNKMTIRVSNLKESNRLAVRKDKEETDKRIPLSFEVGYKGSLHLLFKGTVHRGENFREGPNLITELECLDGGHDYINSFSARTVKGKDEAVNAILSDMPNTQRGKLTTQEPLVRPRILVGSSARLIDQLLDEGQTWYIDEERLYIIQDDEVISSYVPVVSAATGLLSTPTREQRRVTFETQMNLTLRPAGLCQLISSEAPHLNGIYKIDRMGYSGDNYGTDWKQEIVAILAGNYKVL